MNNRLDAAIQAHKEEAFAFLEALVAEQSVVGHEHGAMAAFAREAKALGLVVERLPFPAGPMNDPRAGVAPAAGSVLPERFQVFASTPGEGELLVLLNGHMDVVPAEESGLWTTPPFAPERRGDRLYGRGTSDMKSGFAVGMLALRALRDIAPDLFAKKRLGFIAVLEEECTGNGALNSIVDHDIVAEEVVVLECTDLGLLVGGVGILWLEVEVIAASGHAHSADRSVNAVELGLRLMSGLQAWSDRLRQAEPDPALDPSSHPYVVSMGRIEAGDWTSSSPSVARMSVRVGFPRGWSAEKAEQQVRDEIARLAAEDADFVVPPRVTLNGFRARGYLLEEPSPLIAGLSAAHEDAHGSAPEIYALGSTTDARIYLGDFGIPAVCYGGSGGGMHGIDEYVELESIVAAARTLARFLLTRYSDAEGEAA